MKSLTEHLVKSRLANDFKESLKILNYSYNIIVGYQIIGILKATWFELLVKPIVNVFKTIRE